MAAFDLQLNPAHPGLSFHKLDKAKDKNFWSDLVIQRHLGSSFTATIPGLLLCYVGHQRRRLLLGGGTPMGWKHIRRPARRSWWKCASACRRS